MMHLDSFYFLENNLFTTYTLEVDFPKIYDFLGNQNAAQKAFGDICTLYDQVRFSNLNEHQFEDEFISRILKILGWESIRQEAVTIQGKLEKPDFLLFCDKASKVAFENEKEPSAKYAHVAAVLESKAYSNDIDTKSIKDNPHFQSFLPKGVLRSEFGSHR